MIVLAHSVGAVSVRGLGARLRAADSRDDSRDRRVSRAALRSAGDSGSAAETESLGPGYVKSYVKAKMLTHDPEQAARYDADPLIFRQIAVNILLDLHDTATRLLADAGAINVPTLMLGAGSDWVVSLEAQREFFNGLSSPVKRMHVFPAAYHAIFHEKDRARVVERIREFVLERFAQQPVDDLASGRRQVSATPGRNTSG